MQTLRKLRKLAWAENERYLVRTMLKAIKGRFSQVPQVASLAAGLARYHPSLGVAFVDALLEEVQHVAISGRACSVTVVTSYKLPCGQHSMLCWDSDKAMCCCHVAVCTLQCRRH